MVSVLYVGERIGVAGVDLAVDLRQEDAQHEHRDEDVEQDGEVDEQRHLDAMAVEKRKTPFSMVRNPTMCEKMRWRSVMRISPLSSA